MAIKKGERKEKRQRKTIKEKTYTSAGKKVTESINKRQVGEEKCVNGKGHGGNAVYPIPQASTDISKSLFQFYQIFSHWSLYFHPTFHLSPNPKPG